MSKFNYYKAVSLGIIIFFAGLLRLYNIGNNPPSLSWDEVSIGYNAYSILKTGRDEHGRMFPLDTFISYGDYKPPLSIYVTVPSVAVFGLTEFAVRLPSALAGTLTILLTFFLVLELFQTSRFSFLASLLLAVSPWHIQLSRAGFEANIAVFFIVLGITLVLKTRRKPTLWMIALLPFVAALYTFNSARYFAPLLGVGLLIFVRPFGRATFQWFATGLIVSFLALVPILPHLFSYEARIRFSEVNIFTDPSIVISANERIDYDGGSVIGRLIHNRRIGYARSYLNHFFDHFDPEFLFIRGDGNPKFSIQDVGQLYLVEFPFLIIGVYWILSRFRKEGLLLLYWLITAIIPAAVARETPHALRIENTLPVWQMFIAAGIVSLAIRIRYQLSRSMHIVYSLLLIVLYSLSVTYYLHNYYVHYPREYSGEWQYGYREAIRYIQPIRSQYNRVYMTESIGRPYMYTLFYGQVDPQDYLKTKQSYADAAGFYHVRGFGQFEFVGNALPPFEKGSLYIMPFGTAPDGARILTTIERLNGEPVLEIFDL